MVRALVLFALLSVPLVAPSTAATGPTVPGGALADVESQEASPTYWLRNREGWFWYRDPPLPMPRRTMAPPAETRPRELIEFEVMQKRLDELKRVAVMNPSDANLLAYMRYQRMVMNKSEVFAERWQRLVWTVPDLDHALTGRPTNALAITAFDEGRRKHETQTVRNLASTHGLLFIFRSDCPYCHRMAPIVKRFEQEYGVTVFAVSLDGQGLPEYPSPQPDNGIATRLNASVVPALYLTAPSRREIQPVGFGVMALTDLVQRIAALATQPRAGSL